jgi:thiol-disulfide isomerase/thioredoxin
VIRARSLAAGLALVALLAGCSGSAEKPPARAASPFADCSALTSAPSPSAGSTVASAGKTASSAGKTASSAGSTASSAGSTVASAGKPLPTVTLPCFTGDQKVDIGQIKGPALINLWASWCPPCRQELPVFQRLAGRLPGSLHVIGVVSQDDRGPAQSLAEDLAVSFPTVYDREGALLPRVGGAGLPVTVFVGAAGRISYVYNSEPLDDTTLVRLVKQHLGLVVPA